MNIFEDHNAKEFLKHAENLFSSDLVVFVGAGLSMPLFPSWQDLILKLLEEVSAQKKVDESYTSAMLERITNNEHLVEVAQACVSHLDRSDYRRLLVGMFRKEFKLSEIPSNYKKLEKLNPRLVITTNYDLIPDKLFNDHVSYERSNASEALDAYNSNESVILKIHGTITSQDSIVLTEDDYLKAVYNDDAVNSFLDLIFKTKSVLFVGFSLTDPHIIKIFEKVRSVHQGMLHQHYALLSDVDVFDVNRMKSWGIKVIPYEKGKHETVGYFVEEVQGRLKDNNEVSEPETVKKKTSSLPRIKNSFLNTIKDTELLSKSHSAKDVVLLDDIFVYPDLAVYDELREFEKISDAKDIINAYEPLSKILIAGDKQSGKTALCRRFFLDLYERKFVPIYISYELSQYKGKPKNNIKKAYDEQYTLIDFEDLAEEDIVIILDDFYMVKDKESYLSEIQNYGVIVVVDDIFDLNFKDEYSISSYRHHKIKQLNRLKRNELINKWARLNESASEYQPCSNNNFLVIDRSTELVEISLGKVFGSGIMPAHPFFILSVLTAYETFNKPLDQEITSQGYCYQALIYKALKKQMVENNDMDTYVNFLTEFSFYFFSHDKKEISLEEFSDFMFDYHHKYNLHIDNDVLINKLTNSLIIKLDKFNNYSFSYLYLYYYFVAKYLSENMSDQKEKVNHILNNLHNDENAYISIFISHHSKNGFLLDEILSNSKEIFSTSKQASLSCEELEFFDNQIESLVQAVLPSANTTPEKVREQRLKRRDEIDQEYEIREKKIEDEDVPEFYKDIRRTIKTVEVMGQIIKNRAGSLERDKLEIIFEESVKTSLRLLGHFIEIISHSEQQADIIQFIAKNVEDALKKEQSRKEWLKNQKSKGEIEDIAKEIFWNISFYVIYGMVSKIITSLGSDKLTKIVQKVCDSHSTPVSFIIKHGILMKYSKNLQVENIHKAILSTDHDFSKTAVHILKFLIVNHCSTHAVGYKEKESIEQKFGIPRQKLFREQLQQLQAPVSPTRKKTKGKKKRKKG